MDEYDILLSPRRYQGDMRVMSLQTGGIRSTPFQPKSKKLINQMIPYNHMKHHQRKMAIVKAAIDSKMPSTFHKAIERKRLVEECLYRNWSRLDSRTSTPESTLTVNRHSGDGPTQHTPAETRQSRSTCPKSLENNKQLKQDTIYVTHNDRQLFDEIKGGYISSKQAHSIKQPRSTFLNLQDDNKQSTQNGTYRNYSKYSNRNA